MTGYDLALEDRLNGFLDAADALGRPRLEALARAAHAQGVRPYSLALDPALLEAVRTGCWTAEHDRLVVRVRRRSRTLARRLVGAARPRRRRRLALALESTALAVLLDGTLVAVLEPEVRARLAQPWREVMGADPSAWSGSRAAGCLVDR
jgi:hypothetical protein